MMQPHLQTTAVSHHRVHCCECPTPGTSSSKESSPKLCKGQDECLKWMIAVLLCRPVQALEGYIRCPLGSYHAPEAENKSIGCRRCELGKLRVNATSTKCEPCPDNAQVCLPSKLQMQPGFMVRDIHEPTLNETQRCPNPLACHGTAPGKMCEDGYFGEGCAQCAERHALSDASVLVCVQCAESSVARAFQVLAWLGKSALVFGIAGKSVLGSTGTAKASSIYLPHPIYLPAPHPVCIRMPPRTAPRGTHRVPPVPPHTAPYRRAPCMYDPDLPAYAVLDLKSRRSTKQMALTNTRVLPNIVFIRLRLFDRSFYLFSSSELRKSDPSSL